MHCITSTVRSSRDLQVAELLLVVLTAVVVVGLVAGWRRLMNYACVGGS